jgi:predicted outer membrane protein
MLRIGSNRRMAAPLAMLLAVPFGLGALYAVPMLARTDPPLQRLADEAALAGVNALAASQPLTAPRRAAVSTAAAERMLGDRKATIRAVTPAADKLEVSVELTDPATQASATATARYVPPSAGRNDQESASVGTHAGPPAHL